MLKYASAILSLVLLSPSLAQADQIQLLDRGDQSLAAFYSSINGAQKSIDMATFLFEACDSAPKILLDAMVKKAKAGVHVRLLIDAYSLKATTKAALPAYLAAVPNFELRYYNDAFTIVGNNMRSHIKAFIVDGRSYIVGGRNMQDDYFGLGTKMNYVDHDLLVSGASAAKAQAFYNELWAAGSKAAASGDARTFAASCLAPNARDKAVAGFLAAQGDSVLAARPQRSCAISYTLDNPGFDSCPSCNSGGGDMGQPEEYLSSERYQNKRMTRMFLGFLAGARSRLDVVNQYYLPVYRMDDALSELRDRRVAVSVMTNATGDIDNNASQNQSFTCYIQSSAARTSVGSQRVTLLTSRGALGTPWGLSVKGAKWRIHAKSAIRDGQDVLVSSFNIDPRSYNTNLESGAVVTGCSDLAADLSASYQKLRDEAAADRTCAACKAEVLPANYTPNASCGGLRDFF